MMLRACPRTQEVKELVERGQWPQASPQELRAHVEHCAACADLALVATAFRDARAASVAAAPLGSPGLLWWRAQLRRRDAALERIGRPLLGAQIFALCVTVLLAGGFLAWQARGLDVMGRLEDLPQAGLVQLQGLWTSALAGLGGSPMVLVPALATLALLSGVAVYLAAARQ